MEQWKIIIGFEDYEVSNWGRVRSNKRTEAYILKAAPASNGYNRVSLITGDKTTYKNVHTLVMEAFRGPRPVGYEVRHLDGTRTNARLDNLAYGTTQQNQTDRKTHGTYVSNETAPNAKLTWVLVSEIRALLSVGVSQTDIAKQYGVNQMTISNINTNAQWHDKNWQKRIPVNYRLNLTEVLSLISEGKTHKQIADQFGVTRTAVSNLIRRHKNGSAN